MLAKSAWQATTRTGVGTAGRSDQSICVRLSEKSGSDYDDPRMDSVPLLESHIGEAEALAEVLHVLDHVVQAADEDLLVPVVRDVVLNDLLDVAHAALPIRRLGTRDRRVEVEVRMLPLPLLDQAAVDQVVHVAHAEHDMELMASVEALRPDVAHHRDERRDPGPRGDDHGVFAGPELHGRLLDGGFWHRHRLRRSRPANHTKLGTQRTDLNISGVM